MTDIVTGDLTGAGIGIGTAAGFIGEFAEFAIVFIGTTAFDTAFSFGSKFLGSRGGANFVESGTAFFNGVWQLSNR